MSDSIATAKLSPTNEILQDLDYIASELRDMNVAYSDLFDSLFGGSDVKEPQPDAPMLEESSFINQRKNKQKEIVIQLDKLRKQLRRLQEF